MTPPFRPALPINRPLARLRAMASAAASSQLQAFVLLALMAPMPAAGIAAGWIARYLQSQLAPLRRRR